MDRLGLMTHWLKIGMYALVALIPVLLALTAIIWWYLHPTVQRTNGIVYGARNGQSLQLDGSAPHNIEVKTGIW